MSLVESLEELHRQGETLAPQGGDPLSGYNGRLQPEYVSWRLQSLATIAELGAAGKPILKELESDKGSAYFHKSSAQRVLGGLNAAIALAKRQVASKPANRVRAQRGQQEDLSKGSDVVFLVHGHDNSLLQTTARFLEKLKLRPIVLLEQPARGQTIIEKLEAHADAAYAVVILTPDDVGRSAKELGEGRPRARQNVILELGYFVGRLGRDRVGVLFDESVELPSDYRGVEYIRLDAEGAWKLKLAKELREAGLVVDMNNAI